MRRTIAALIAISGIAAIPAISDAAPDGHAAMVKVVVKPSTGSPRTQFEVSFRAAQASDRTIRNSYRINAALPPQGHGGCQAGAGATVRPTKAGSTARVVLAPNRPGGWCAGNFRGQVWDVITVVCPVGRACPDIVPAPRMIGTFTFRVTRG
jgi:hypothetical protein